MPSPPSRFTRLKIFLGYASLLALLLIALLYIHREIEHIEAIDREQLLNSDSLQALIKEKDRRMLAFFRETNRPEGYILSEEDIEKLMQSPPPRIQRHVVIRHDSVVHKTRPKSFLKRVAEVFAPRQDSALQTSTRIEVITDTLHTPSPGDSLKKDLADNLRQKDSALTALRKRRERIRRNEQILSAQIDSIITRYEADAARQSEAFQLRQQELRRKSVYAIASIAVAALLLAAVFLFIICRDLTRNKRYRIQLEEARRHAEELLRAREQMMLAITHDFKAPLGNIMGYAELLEGKLTEEGQREDLRHMQSSARHLMELIRKLLNFHRLEQKKTELVAVPFSPARFFREIAADFLPAARAKRIELLTDFSDLPDEEYEADTVQLRQLTDNLMSNALKFTDRGSVTLRARMQNGWLRLAVQDTGQGIDEADRERIFRSFTRLPGAQGREGFGLGLSIVHELVELFGGEIRLDSTKGQGTTFTVLLPLRKADAPQKDNEQEDTAAAQQRNQLEGIRFLIIDDDRIQLRLTRQRLCAQGATADCCVEPDELFDHLRNARYDFILTDVQMPAISGFKLLELLRASNLPGAKDTPIIAVTAREMEESEFTSKGFAGCLHKPYSTSEVARLTTRIRKLSAPKGSAEKAAALPPESGSTFAGERQHFSQKGPAGPDWQALAAFCGGDEKETRELLTLFRTETERDIRSLQKAKDEGDRHTISHLAHKQLPMFRIIGAEECVRLMARLEKRGEAFTPETGDLAGQLIAAEKRILNSLQNLLQ